MSPSTRPSPTRSIPKAARTDNSAPHLACLGRATASVSETGAFIINWQMWFCKERFFLEDGCCFAPAVVGGEGLDFGGLVGRGVVRDMGRGSYLMGSG